MEPTTVRERKYPEYQTTESLLEEDTFEAEDNGMSDEDLKIESLKIATNICKLMNNVLPEDIIEVAEKVANFIKNGAPLDASGETSAEETAPEEESDFEEVETEEPDGETETEDFEEDFVTDDEEESTEEPAEEEETEEDFEV